MLSRRSYYVIARWNVLVPPNRLCSCTGCLAKYTSTSGHRNQQLRRYNGCLTSARDLRPLRRDTCVGQLRAMSTTPTPPPPPSPLDDDDKSQSIFQRFKSMAKKYWYIVLPVHLITSTVWFGSFFFIASSGCDVPALLEMLGLPIWVVDKVRDGHSWTSYLVIAYGLYKIFTPLRYMVTLGGTGMTIRYLRRLGYGIGEPPKKPQI